MPFDCSEINARQRGKRKPKNRHTTAKCAELDENCDKAYNLTVLFIRQYDLMENIVRIKWKKRTFKKNKTKRTDIQYGCIECRCKNHARPDAIIKSNIQKRNENE